MKSNFFVAIYLITVFSILIVQALKIKELRNRINESDRIRKEIYILGDKIQLIKSKQEVYDLILTTALNVIQKGNKGSILIQEEDRLFHYKTIRGFNSDISLSPLPKEELALYKYNGCKDIAILKSSLGHKNEYILVSPISSDGKLIGVINIYSGEGSHKFTDEDIKLLRYIKREFEVEIKNFLTQDKLKHIATHDELTGLYNRRSFNQIFEDELNEVKKNGIESVLAIIDLDDFKVINDTFGHRAGDEALVKMASAMRKCLGKNDTYARMSGDEFVIIFRKSTVEDVKEKLSSINDILTMSSENIKIGFTYGLATISIDSTIEKDEVFSCADRMLYMEKKKKKVGR